jgi:S1-C subfamily serine protease
VLKNVLTVVAFLLALGTFIRFYTKSQQVATFATVVDSQENQPTFPLSSFVQVKKLSTVHVCEKLKKRKKKKRKKRRSAICLEGEYKVLASGFVVANDEGGSYVLTAAHVCHDINEIEKVNLKEQIDLLGRNVNIKIMEIDMFTYDTNDNEYSTTIVDLYGKDDICLIYSENLNEPAILPAKKDLDIGMQVYNIAAPAGFHFANVMPILDGRYSGVIEGRDAVYTIPSTHGSSGSPIINKNGEYVGMVVATITEFEQITFSPTRKNIINFVSYVLYNKECGELYHISPHYSDNL